MSLPLELFKGVRVRIRVKLYGVFRMGRFKEETLEIPDGTQVDKVVEHLGLPRHLLGIVLVNGRHSGVDAVLCDGDELSLLPLLGGG